MQVVESERARALTLDSQTWEIQFLHSTDNHSKGLKRSYMRVAMIKHSDIKKRTFSSPEDENTEIDDRIIELFFIKFNGEISSQLIVQYMYYTYHSFLKKCANTKISAHTDYKNLRDHGLAVISGIYIYKPCKHMHAKVNTRTQHTHTHMPNR